MTEAEAAERRARGWTNRPPAGAGVSTRAIVARNTFTWINLIFAVLGAASLATGAGPDATFLIIAALNTVVGSVEEIRAKRKLDALSVINAPRARVVRDATLRELPVEEVVLDDVLEVGRGNQVVADAQVLSGDAEVDESLVTGESDSVAKRPGDQLLSGSWVVSGSLRAVVVAVGAESFAGRLATEARRYSLTGSELMGGINRILRRLAVIMLLVAPALIVRQLQVQPWRPAVRSTVAGLVGMVPEGLVLLATLAFVTAAVRLGRRNVLVQELPAVETLARVDVLCTDKTGTLTEGHLEWDRLVTAEAVGPGTRAEAEEALAAIAAGPDTNPTLAAIASGSGPSPEWTALDRVGFSSERKWSAASFDGHGTWVLGAPEMVAAADPDDLATTAARLAATGARVLVLARTGDPLNGPRLPSGLALAGVVVLRERLRPDAAAALAYFRRQQVAVRVLSGDSAATAGAVAARAGLTDVGLPVDARSWPGDAGQQDELMETRTVFGRVTPEEKREMVDALHRRGHTVAMTGDGVNDAVALKRADLGVAMGSGSDVTRGVAQLVLLDNRFAVLPAVVSEGRRVLHNIERVALLFLVKNVYSIVISVVVAIAGWPYPFLPRHLSLVSALGIGVPAFFLALAPSDERFHPGFVRRVVTLASMTGVVAAAAVLLTYALARGEHTSPDVARTAAVIVVIVISLWVLLLASRPLRAWKVALVVTDAAAFAAAFYTPGIDRFFSLSHRPDAELALEAVGIALAACLLVTAVYAVDARRRSAPAEPGPRAQTSASASATSARDR
ncbi:HAD-IC family P-type ATPase [Acidimicrobiaceae bacterium USS-CC1]|uniref:HAD-IC family P-type ATPase n=1 Tax=Acidiferrimicrobium australe TaxID=2664430 RepID=A0ABW9QPU9_9ACTN|nr:HAD-IC family P-type ATPase [Acidiferrimicrobium australe]